MGRHSTGATSTDASKRISISFLKKHGYLESGTQEKGVVNFSYNGEPSGSITIVTDTHNEPYIQLLYSVSNHSGEEKTKIDYKVELRKVPSNLGKGYRYYFVCPFSGRNCEIIYMAYGSHYFKHRDAYRHRLYYPCQMESKTSVAFRHHLIRFKIEELYSKLTKCRYKGNKTRLVKRIENLEEKYKYYSRLADLRLVTLFAKRGFNFSAGQ